MTLSSQHLSDEEVLSLVRRMDLESKLVRRHLEEQIIALVPLDDAWVDEPTLGSWKVVLLKSTFMKRLDQIRS